MNRILLGTSLLLTAELCGQSAQAAPNYTSNTHIVSPVGGNYSATYPAEPLVPFAVVDQYVQVTGVAPSSFISISWSMSDTAYNAMGSNPVFANDQSNGPTVEMVNGLGTFIRYVNNSKDGVIDTSHTDDPHIGGPRSFISSSSITDSHGTSYLLVQNGTWTTSVTD